MIKVLVADDDVELLNVLKTELSEQNMQVTAVKNGIEALIAAAEQDFDVVILDMHMPHVDGLQAIIVLRKLLPKAGIIGLTGNLGQGYMASGIKYGVSVLSKPISLERLINEVNEALERVQMVEKAP